MRVEHEYTCAGAWTYLAAWMSTEQESLVVVKRGVELDHLIDWWIR